MAKEDDDWTQEEIDASVKGLFGNAFERKRW
jgi:hypothetical protein